MDKLKQRERSSSSSIIYDISSRDNNTLYSSHSYNDHPYHNNHYDNPLNNISSRLNANSLNAADEANDIKRRDEMIKREECRRGRE